MPNVIEILKTRGLFQDMTSPDLVRVVEHLLRFMPDSIRHRAVSKSEIL